MSDTKKRDAVLDRYSGNGWDYPDHEAMAWRIVELEAAVERVRALHYSKPPYDDDEDYLFCKECGDVFPCPTLRALPGAP